MLEPLAYSKLAVNITITYFKKSLDVRSHEKGRII